MKCGDKKKDLLQLWKDEVGFPKGEIKDIMVLSDPPYYTACPNPFIGDFIKYYGRPYDPNEPYHREPFAADVSEGKNNPIYNAHSYHTKVPHKAIMRYILHYTEPGDIVYDGFCGTGMTGVAAQLCGDRRVASELGYLIGEDGTIKDTDGNEVSKLGARRAILNDLSPAATFIAYNYNTPVNAVEFELEAKRILAEVEQECGWMYFTLHTPKTEQMAQAQDLLKSKKPAEWSKDESLPFVRINYTVWSDVFVCPECTNEVVFWEAAVDKAEGKVLDEFSCPHCSALLTKRRMDRAWATIYDGAIYETIQQAKQEPVLINYSSGKKRFEKRPDEFDRALIDLIDRTDIPYWFPTDRMPEGDEARRNDGIGLTHAHHFYSKRNVKSLAFALSRVVGSRYYDLWQALLRGSTSYSTKMVKVNVPRLLGGGGLFSFGAVTGTLYVPSLLGERPVLDAMY
ncbi:MAG: site-specific DNA-methyltransferase, partial [Candidatus Marsarchaeota archaeon]|nr:site-specific DNA-methyltransferase [Candidatus Marsarchaeota archaeon]